MREKNRFWFCVLVAHCGEPRLQRRTNLAMFFFFPECVYSCAQFHHGTSICLSNPGGITATCRGCMQRSCSENETSQGPSWWGSLCPNLEILFCLLWLRRETKLVEGGSPTLRSCARWAICLSVPFVSELVRACVCVCVWHARQSMHKNEGYLRSCFLNIQN